MIIPGILEESFEQVEAKVKLLGDVPNIISVDIKDGNLTEGATFTDVSPIDQLHTSAEFELHLMVKNPIDFVKTKLAKVTKVVAQLEGDNIDEFIEQSTKNGYITGLSISPETPPESLEKYLSAVQYVQFMTVYPGTSGQDFLPEVLDKIAVFRKKFPYVTIQTDGGNNETTIPQLKEAGVNDFAVTSAIFSEEDPAGKLLELERLLLQ